MTATGRAGGEKKYLLPTDLKMTGQLTDQHGKLWSDCLADVENKAKRQG
jgi:hypothetical protein